jgi:HSP20 family protein
MPLVRWEPVRELTSLQQEMNRLFNTFFDTPSGGTQMRRWVPAMDLVETDSEFVLRADLPGLSEKDVNIEIEGDVLTVSGERRAEHEQSKEGYYRVERSFGSFSRSLTLPEGIDAERVHARFENGVLEIRVPKPAERQPRRVSISVGGAPATLEGAESGQAAAGAGAERETGAGAAQGAATESQTGAGSVPGSERPLGS